MSDVVDRLAASRIVAVLTAADADEAERAGEALLAGGLTSVEITFRTEAAADAIRRVARNDELLVGAGTILSPDQLALAVDAGARFASASSRVTVSSSPLRRFTKSVAMPRAREASAKEIVS